MAVSHTKQGFGSVRLVWKGEDPIVLFTKNPLGSQAEGGMGMRPRPERSDGQRDLNSRSREEAQK